MTNLVKYHGIIISWFRRVMRDSGLGRTERDANASSTKQASTGNLLHCMLVQTYTGLNWSNHRYDRDKTRAVEKRAPEKDLKINSSVRSHHPRC